MNIPGSWTLYFDWGCDGGVGNSKITFNANGTFASSPYTGKWFSSTVKSCGALTRHRAPYTVATA